MIMKATIAVLDKHGDSVVSRVLDLLNSYNTGQPMHFGVISPKKSFLEKPLGIINRQGVETSTLIGYASTKPAVSSGYEFLQLEDAAVALEGRIYEPVAKSALTEQVAKEPQHCEAALQTLLEKSTATMSL